MAKVRGGHKLRRFLSTAKAAQKKSVKRVSVGFFSTDKYPDGTPVTNVAAWNEFGTKRGDDEHAPPRPFMRRAQGKMETTIGPLIKAHIDPETLEVTREVASYAGQMMQTLIQDEIRHGQFEPNAPSTIASKLKPHTRVSAGYEISRPLIDTGDLRQSVTYKIYYNEGD